MAVKTPGNTGHLFARKPLAKANREPTHESIAADLTAFEEAGGVIEKLGNTCTLKHIAASEGTHPAPANPPRKAKSGATA
ncbi:hypothetical protein LVB87_01380 [Lysobacter sp. KIS68-7]|uniref:hypothetical protein n=1 Tax=Lysobacter sp. KIS68-7 TaxID=2904252 RepID=UPI001E5398A8|nr:hypothetical protein [Lysobacter sp. KIS68-7]UHQ19845.1 hypothetical protein LVB87_01380 [Lysobacter sp. KIS68-7]